MNSGYLRKFVHLSKNLELHKLFTRINLSSDSLWKQKKKTYCSHASAQHIIVSDQVQERGSNEASRTDPLSWSLPHILSNVLQAYPGIQLYMMLCP